MRRWRAIASGPRSTTFHRGFGMPRKFQTHCQPAPNPYPTMNEIPETIPWVTESFGSNDGSSDAANIRTPASTPSLETGLEKTLGLAIYSSNANDNTFGRYASRDSAGLAPDADGASGRRWRGHAPIWPRRSRVPQWPTPAFTPPSHQPRFPQDSSQLVVSLSLRSTSRSTRSRRITAMARPIQPRTS